MPAARSSWSRQRDGRRRRGAGARPRHRPERRNRRSEIFELFAQVDTSIERARGGLGIGLTLVRRLVEMHGGEVTRAQRRPRPRQRVPRAPAARSRCTVRPHRRRPMRRAPSPQRRRRRAVARWCVDDNRDAADTLAMMLELLGHEVRRLYDPHASVGGRSRRSHPRRRVPRRRHARPAAATTSRARCARCPAANDVLLVAVTGWGQPEDRRRTQEAGFDHHLVKPPELDAIRGICARARRGNAAPA